MSQLVPLGKSDVPQIAELLTTVFWDDPGVGYIFSSTKSRQRWLKRFLTASVRFMISYGAVLGIRDEATREIIAVAYWFYPHRPYPPRWYRTLIPSWRLLPLMFHLPLAFRDDRIQKLFRSLLPKKRRFLYLGALAVKPAHRGRELGRQFVQWGKDYATEKQCALFLHCWEPLRPYYERYGLEEFSQDQLEAMAETCYGMIWSPPSERQL